MKVTPKTCYVVECRRKGKVIWREEFHNLVTTVGKNKLLDACFKTGEGANQWFVGLVNNAGFAAYSVADTMAAHGGWAEDTDYTEANRQAFACGVPAGGSADNSASRAVFTMNATVTIRGAFLVDSNVKGGAAGTLYGVGDFSVARGVISGDQVYAQATVQVT
jgi:hypothetical protein